MSSRSGRAPNPIIIDSDQEEDDASKSYTEPDQITLDSSKEENDFDLSTKPDHLTAAASSKKAKTTDLMDLCPLSTPQAPCDWCKVEKIDGDKILNCHCGAESKTLKKGRVE